MSRDEARLWLVRTCLMTPSTAESLLGFVDRYRTYVVGYALGPQLIAEYIEKHGGTDAVRRDVGNYSSRWPPRRERHRD